MPNNQNNDEVSLYVASGLAIIFVLVAAAIAWGTLPPAKRGLGEASSVEVTSVEAGVETEPAQASTGDSTVGQELFTATCAACHGPAGEGIQGLGKNMTTNEFIASLTDEELVEFIKVGRDPSDPLNTTGIGMPAKGGNPALTDEDLYDIVAFIRNIQQ